MDAAPASPDREDLILDAVLDVLAEEGLAGVSMRAVARRAGVGLGLVGYYYEDKAGLIRAALVRIGELDLEILDADPLLPPAERLRTVLRHVAEPRYLTTHYLALRLQLWSLAQAGSEYEEINTSAQRRYRERLAALIGAARPELSKAACAQRAMDIDVVQNGLWLTALLGLDRRSVQRSVARCEAIAFDE